MELLNKIHQSGIQIWTTKLSIIEEMKVAPEIVPKIEIESRVSFIQNQLEQAESKTLVLGNKRWRGFFYVWTFSSASNRRFK